MANQEFDKWCLRWAEILASDLTLFVASAMGYASIGAGFYLVFFLPMLQLAVSVFVHNRVKSQAGQVQILLHAIAFALMNLTIVFLAVKDFQGTPRHGKSTPFLESISYGMSLFAQSQGKIFTAGLVVLVSLALSIVLCYRSGKDKVSLARNFMLHFSLSVLFGLPAFWALTCVVCTWFFTLSALLKLSTPLMIVIMAYLPAVDVGIFLIDQINRVCRRGHHVSDVGDCELSDITNESPEGAEQGYNNEAFEADEDPFTLYYTFLMKPGSHDFSIVLFKDIHDIELETQQFDMLCPRKKITVNGQNLNIALKPSSPPHELHPNQHTVPCSLIRDELPYSTNFTMRVKGKKKGRVEIECNITVDGSEEPHTTSFSVTLSKSDHGGHCSNCSATINCGARETRGNIIASRGSNMTVTQESTVNTVSE